MVKRQWSIVPQRGFIALITLIIIAAATLTIGLSVNLLSISESQMGLIHKKGQEAFIIAESCLEEALIQLRYDTNYDPDGGSVVIDTITCDSIDITGSGSNKTIFVTVTLLDESGSFTKKLETVVRRTGNSITIEDWAER